MRGGDDHSRLDSGIGLHGFGRLLGTFRDHHADQSHGLTRDGTDGTRSVHCFKHLGRQGRYSRKGAS